MSDIRECVVCGCQHLSDEINQLQARVAELQVLKKRAENVAKRLDKLSPADRRLVNSEILIQEILKGPR